MDRYAVFGHPVGHSKSPQIHAAFAAQTGQSLSYEAIDAPPDGFAAALREFIDQGGRGCNVTVPFKDEAYRLADRCDALAGQAQAVNTLRVEPDGRLAGFNTDGVGLLRDLTQNLGLALAGRRVLLVGAGGAAAGIIGPLLAAGIARAGDREPHAAAGRRPCTTLRRPRTGPRLGPAGARQRFRSGLERHRRRS